MFTSPKLIEPDQIALAMESPRHLLKRPRLGKFLPRPLRRLVQLLDHLRRSLVLAQTLERRLLDHPPVRPPPVLELPNQLRPAEPRVALGDGVAERTVRDLHGRQPTGQPLAVLRRKP